MIVVPREALDQFEALMKEADAPQKRTFQNVHQGHPRETLMQFLKAREGNVVKAHEMLVDCLNWRVENDIDGMLAKPIIPVELYRAMRDTQLIGLSGYSKEGLPVFAVGVGLSTFDRASVVKPLLQERTRRKINALSGCRQDELLKIMDYSSLPHFCHKRSSGSVHVTLPKDVVEGDFAKILESELEKYEALERCSDSFDALKINSY